MTTAPEPKLQGWQAIAAVLSEIFGVPISEDAAYRLAGRRVRPLPVDGYQRRPVSSRAAIEAWATGERKRTGRSDLSAAQLGLFK